MRQNGRKSAASLAIAVPIRGISRPEPPPELKLEAERAVWLRTVNARPADWFGPEHVPLLVSYCRHVVGADQIAGQLAEVTSQVLADPDGFRRHERLRKMMRDETTAVLHLARSMRLTHHSLYQAQKASRAVERHGSGSRPWE
jgi:hypothetical protein